jgi:hypothetical protein
MWKMSWFNELNFQEALRKTVTIPTQNNLSLGRNLNSTFARSEVSLPYFMSYNYVTTIASGVALVSSKGPTHGRTRRTAVLPSSPPRRAILTIATEKVISLSTAFSISCFPHDTCTPAAG